MPAGGTAIRWSMLFSHHPPVDHDHTLKIGTVRVCTRCTGVAIGLILFLILKNNLGIAFFGTRLGVFFFLTSLTPIDVSAHEIGKWRGSNPVRLILGFFIGIALACGATTLLEGKPAIGFGLILWMLLLEFLAAAFMKWRGCLDALVRRYELGIRIDCSTKEHGTFGQKVN